MSRDLFGFKDEPFSAYPDNKYFFSSINHDKAITLLEYGLNSRKGFMLLTGLKGTGKTMTCNILKNSVTNCNVSMVDYDTPSADELMRTTCRGFGLDVGDEDRQALFGKIMEYFVEEYKSGNNNLIIIDRADNISGECLQMLSQFMEIEIEKCKLVQVIISGGPELHDRLKNLGGELGPKFTFTVELAPLNLHDTTEYVEHRVKTAIEDADMHLFKPNSYALIYEYSKGVPSEINRIAQKALEIAKEGKKTKITSSHIKMAAARLYGVRATRKGSKAPVALFLILVVLGVASFLYKDKIASFVSKDTAEVASIQHDEKTLPEPDVARVSPAPPQVIHDSIKVEPPVEAQSDAQAEVDPAPQAPVVEKTDTSVEAVVEPVEPPVAEQPAPTPEPVKPEPVVEEKIVQHGCITAYSGLKVRTSPSVQGELMGTAPYMGYIELIEMTADGKWWKAKFEGEDGYMYAKYIKLVDSPEKCSN